MPHHLRRIRTPGRGFVDPTAKVAALVAERVPEGEGIVHLFLRHTSAALVITENADPDVRADLERLARRWAPDGDPAYAHTLEGPDDTAARGRAVLSGASLSIPFARGRLLLGTWQGIFLWEQRTTAHEREIVLTLLR